VQSNVLQFDVIRISPGLNLPLVFRFLYIINVKIYIDVCILNVGNLGDPYLVQVGGIFQ